MKIAARTWILCTVLATLSAYADPPHLVNERRVFPEGEPVWKTPPQYTVWAMRLSPDGAHLLFSRAIGQPLLTPQGTPDWNNVRYETVLRDLSSGKETILPINSLESAWHTIFTRFNVFDPAGSRLSLTKIDVKRPPDNDKGMVSEIMSVVVYDIASGKLTATELRGSSALAKFDRKGTSLIGAIGEQGRETPGLFTAALPNLKTERLQVKAWLQSVCPAADVVCLWTPPERVAPAAPGQRPQRGPQRLFLYDLVARKQIAELPVSQLNNALDDWETQWTLDGRYLYYYDVTEVEGEGRPRPKTRPVTRIWDRVANGPSWSIPDTLAVGPGPTPTTMVLASETDRGYAGFSLHDAKSGDRHPLGDASMRLVHAWGSKVLYVKPSPEGEDTLCVADIAAGASPGPGR